ncbi:MAG: hypothetical protein H6510_16485 [Acidobacteria bacterium]|nr:hypothetical protein [Acidobacteriota bacterium]MCB9399412.1 hypothetical protein [Acidobacteriota bacterium]
MNCEACGYEIEEDEFQENDGLCLECWASQNTTFSPQFEDQPMGCGPDDSCVPYIHKEEASD